jgi:3-methyladenine DNA glycosylase AlkD
MKAKEILAQLEAKGAANTKKTLMNHGGREPIFGVKVQDMKPMVKKIGKDYQLALDLYDSGVYDAMYMAGLIADEKKMSKKDLQHWLDQAYCPVFAEYTVPWVAAESPHGWELGNKWIEAKKETAASAGWGTLGFVASYLPDAQLDLPAYEKLLGRVASTVHDQPNRVKYAMNNFVIFVGAHVVPLHKKALAAAKAMGAVEVDMGGTACKVPSAAEYIGRVEARGSLGKKRKTTRC